MPESRHIAVPLAGRNSTTAEISDFVTYPSRGQNFRSVRRLRLGHGHPSGQIPINFAVRPTNGWDLSRFIGQSLPLFRCILLPRIRIVLQRQVFVVRVSECQHSKFKIDPVKDGVGQDLLLCVCEGCGFELAVLLDECGKPLKFWRNEPRPCNELWGKKNGSNSG